MPPFADKRAIRILHETYWSAAGWRPEPLATLAAADFEFAKASGVMFEPATLTHDQALARLRAAMEKTSIATVSAAFVRSLATRDLASRSAIGSYVLFRHLPPHDAPRDGVRCPVCGLYGGEQSYDLNVLNFERYKWGGVRHSDVVYASLDLELFSRLPAVQPTEPDLQLLQALLDAIAGQSPKTTSAQLHTRLPKELKSNKAERDVLVGLLGMCGILATKSHPGFLHGFVPASARHLPDRRFVDMAYPACWWTGRDGVDWEAAADLFGRHSGQGALRLSPSRAAG